MLDRRRTALQRAAAFAIVFACGMMPLASASESGAEFIESQIAMHEGRTGTHVLEKGKEALLARAWLADHAQKTIEVQYFIWSTDNIGMLAAEALLRAAERGVMVRVIVDDLLIDAHDKSLLALAMHPHIEIRIYNPRHRVGTPLHKRVWNVVTDFRGVNQRMHDKTFIVDGRVAITGGRNMADEYFDYDREYNFRDRDVLLLGDAVREMRASFENFWSNRLSAPVESLYDGVGLVQKRVTVKDAEIQTIFADLHAYAASPDNFPPAVRRAIAAIPETFPRLIRELTWGKVEFIHDLPGKNATRFRLGGGGATTDALARLADSARRRIVIQSPYLVLSDKAIELFRKILSRGVRVRICTNSLASTDNVQAFSGYRNQRSRLLAMGFEIFEYKLRPKAQRQLMPARADGEDLLPVFAIHAKSMVVDSSIAFVGTFNFDPRSENLNTEAGVILHNAHLARAIEGAIENDMLPANSWNAGIEKPDRHAPLHKRLRVRFWQGMPIQPLL